MNLFIIGPSGTGKTPVAKYVADNLGFQLVKSSQYFREGFQKNLKDYETRGAFVNAITEYSLGELKKDPMCNINYINNHYDMSKDCVIEGIRNPNDFMAFFNPKTDYVLELYYVYTDIIPSKIESGISVIRDIIQWNIAQGIMDKKQYYEFNFEYFWDKERVSSCIPSLEGFMKNEISEFLKGE